MRSVQSFCRRASFYLTFIAAVAPLFSIAACDTLMGFALLTLLLSRERLRFPPIKLPLALFFLGTVVSLLLSADPVAGLPQIRKFYVFAIVLLVYSVFRELDTVRRLVLACVGAATLSAGLSLVQFQQKWHQAHLLGVPFYPYYVGERTTGFMSHWMTFGGGMMIVLLLLAAFLFFSPVAKRWLVLWLGCAVIISIAIVLGFTRSIWLGSTAGGLFLLWYWRRKLILAVPVLLVLLLWLGPASLRERFDSLVHPHGEIDSNQQRIVTWRTGWRMIEAHPWFGLGPEEIAPNFERYVPADVGRPLPEGWYGHLHNIYLQYAAARGIPTMLVMMWLLGKILFDFLRALRRRAPFPGAWYVYGAVAVLLAILVEGFFEMNLGDSEVLTLFLVVVAGGYVVLDAAGLRPAGQSG